MENPPLFELMKKVDSRYTLCNAISRRARQLTNGALPLTQCSSNKPVIIAMHEYHQGKFSCTRTKNVHPVSSAVKK